MSKNVVEMKHEIDFIIQALNEVDGFISGLKLLADKEHGRTLHDLGVKVRACREKSVDMWQCYSLDDYKGLEALLKGEPHE